MRDPYLYDNIDVLKNKLDIKDANELDAIERDITAAKLMDVDDIKGDFDFQRCKNIHEHIFGDIYDWAGKERTIPVQKSERVLNGLSVEYTQPGKIEKEAEKCISKMNSTDWKSLSLDQRANQYAKDVAALWQIHPFREGNTRTTMTFACQFADAHGFPMDRQLLSEHAGYTRNALVMASIGEYSETEHLAKIFKDSMERGAEQQRKKNLEQKSPKISADRFVNLSFVPPEQNSPENGSRYDSMQV